MNTFLSSLHGLVEKGFSLTEHLSASPEWKKRPNLDQLRKHTMGIMSILQSSCYITNLLISLTRLLQRGVAVRGSWLPRLHCRVKSDSVGKNNLDSLQSSAH